MVYKYYYLLLNLFLIVTHYTSFCVLTTAEVKTIQDQLLESLKRPYDLKSLKENIKKLTNNGHMLGSTYLQKALVFEAPLELIGCLVDEGMADVTTKILQETLTLKYKLEYSVHHVYRKTQEQQATIGTLPKARKNEEARLEWAEQVVEYFKSKANEDMMMDAAPKMAAIAQAYSNNPKKFFDPSI
jgi:hypothetical protein